MPFVISSSPFDPELNFGMDNWPENTTDSKKQWSVKTKFIPVLQALEKKDPATFMSYTLGRFIGGVHLDGLYELIACIHKINLEDFTDGRYQDVLEPIADLDFGMDNWPCWLHEYLSVAHATKRPHLNAYSIREREKQIAHAEEAFVKLKEGRKAY